MAVEITKDLKLLPVRCICMVPQLTVPLRFAGSTGCCRMISCRSLAGCLRKTRDKLRTKS